MNLVVFIIIGSLAGFATGIGGLLGVLFKPSERYLMLGLSFSSGIMLGVTFLMLVPESLGSGFLPSFIGFALGSLFFFFLDIALPHIHTIKSRSGLLRLGILIAVGMALHDIPEGFGIGSGFGISESFGIAIAIGVMLHNLPEGIAIAIPLYSSGISRFKTILICFVAGITTLVGAIAAYFLLGSFTEPMFHSGLAFAAGAMFFITVNELIPEAQKYGHSRVIGLGVLIGILMAFFLTLL